MSQIISSGMTADHAKSLADWLREDDTFCTALVGADRMSMISVVDTVYEACAALEEKLSGKPENSYDHNIQTEVRNLSSMIIASVHTLNSVSDDGRRAVSGEVLQRVTAGALEAARSLRFRIAQMAEMAKQDATPAATAAPKQRGKTNASRAGR
jgi:hypothetical protein